MVLEMRSMHEGMREVKELGRTASFQSGAQAKFRQRCNAQIHHRCGRTYRQRPWHQVKFRQLCVVLNCLSVGSQKSGDQSQKLRGTLVPCRIRPMWNRNSLSVGTRWRPPSRLCQCVPLVECVRFVQWPPRVHQHSA